MQQMLLIILLSFSVLSAEEFSMESKSTFVLDRNDNGMFTRITNSTFKALPRIVIQETINIERQFGAEGSLGELESKAFNYENNMLWKINDLAHEALVFDKFYVTFYQGCCDAEDTKAYFNIYSGKKIFSSTSMLKFKFSNDKLFYVSFLSISSTKDFPPQYNYKNRFNLLLSVASDNNVISRIAIQTPNDISDYDYTPDDIYFINSDHSDFLLIDKRYKDESSLSDIEFEFDYWGTLINIRLQNGKLYIPNSNQYKGFKFEIITGNEKDSYLFNENFLNLTYKSKDELRLIRNEIFARNGQSFINKDLRRYFNSKEWYQEKSDHNVAKNELTLNEQIVLTRILDLEND